MIIRNTIDWDICKKKKKKKETQKSLLCKTILKKFNNFF